MRLSELLDYDNIVIQCHDNPDADALASGYALHYYLTKMGKDPMFIYRGRNPIGKSNLIMMIDVLDIPVIYEPEFDICPELLVTVDCQYGQQNVTKTNADNVAIIDHHQIAGKLPELFEIRSNMGSCATVIWDMMREEGISVDDRRLATALYYGLYTDTGRLSEVSHPLDRDMIDSLNYDKSIITELSNSNISLDELKITGRAILNYEYNTYYKFLLIHAEKCDPTILGVISDFSMETIGVNVCIAFYTSPEEIKFSVRSCVKEVHANEVASFVAENIGGGGGHIRKAGGAIFPKKLQDREGIGEDRVSEYFAKKMEEYYKKYEIIYAKDTVLDTSEMKKYEKLPQKLGYVKLTDICPPGTLVEIRTLEGDINIRCSEDTYLMIGVEGEVYPISREKLSSSYKETGEKYERNFEYEPFIKNLFTDEKKSVMSAAKEVVSAGTAHIYAKPLTGYIKLFTAWDNEKYYSGKPGDYIAVREDDEHDIYIINERLFHQLYTEI